MGKRRKVLPYYTMEVKHEKHEVEIFIFGDIASGENKTAGSYSSNDLVKELAGVPDHYSVTVHINTPGGEVKEALAIYNVLKRRQTTTICEGFAASAGSVVFVAGKRRIMETSSLIFIHDVRVGTCGNADEIEKLAKDSRKVTESVISAYVEAGVTLSRDELRKLMKNETWITPEEAIKNGFATSITADTQKEAYNNSAVRYIKNHISENKPRKGRGFFGFK